MVAPDHVQDVKPSACTHCAAPLTGEDSEPWRHQVIELPRAVAQVTEYRFHTLDCEGCGKSTRPAWPAEVPRGAFGPRLQSLVAVLSGTYRLSKRSIVQLLQDAFGARISLGSVSKAEADVSAALEAPFEEARKRLKRVQVANVDETGWFLSAQRAWLWVAASATVVVFLLRKHRSQAVARELLRGFSGVIGTDHCNVYHFVSDQRRQLCWAHLARQFQGLLDFTDAKPFGEKLLEFCERLFAAWHRKRDGTTSFREFKTYAVPLSQELGQLLRDGVGSSSAPVSRLCKGLLKHESSLWTFTRRMGVEPTNNAAERALRPAVIWRKTSFGSDSERGLRFAERILTVTATLRRQHRNVLDFVTAAMSGSTPSLLSATP
jgi:transposase